jgi:predicted nucleic-acid-binding Zn-ribbon protein
LIHFSTLFYLGGFGFNVYAQPFYLALSAMTWRIGMPLTAAQKEKIQDWLNLKRVKPFCPSCVKSEWGFGEILTTNIYGAPESHSGPMIQIGCLYCGYIRLYAVHKDMKLFEP